MDASHINLDGYFDFLDKDDIRVRGTRVGIETILDDYMNAFGPEEIASRYPTLTLEQVYATLTYYFRNRDKVDRYLQRCEEHTEKLVKNQLLNPTSAVKRLREMKMRRQSETKEFSA